MLSDRELIEGCLKQQNYAQKMLYKKYAPEMKALCFMYLKDRDLVKDAIQDSFIKIFNNLNSYRSDGSLGAWIRRIVVNTALNYLRKSNKKGDFLIKEDPEQIDIIDETTEDDEALDDMINELTGEDIHQAISQLPEKFRLIFSFFYLEDYSHKEIAEKLEINEALSRVWLSRSKKMLKIILLDDVLTKTPTNEKGSAKK
jgi:RNA polymerase sigma factor (sigma-70 family)